MDERHRLAAASRDGHLALRRVERHQRLIEILARSTTALTTRQLADRLGVSTRTVERDVERLRDAGVPFRSRPGRGGGVRFSPATDCAPIAFDVAEIAAILSSLAAVGPNSSPSAASAAGKLTAALRPIR